MNIEVYKQVEREYDLKRQKAENDRNNRLSELKSKLPKYTMLQDKKNSIAIEHAKTILTCSGVEKQVAEENLSIKLDDVEKEIQQLLRSNGYQDNCLDVKHECDKCKDTGTITGSRGTSYCSCFTQQILNRTYRQDNMLRLEEENFNTFDIGYYSDKSDKQKYQMDLSPRENILNIKEIAEKFSKNINNKNQKSLLFVGDTGTGKTFMSNAIADAVIKNGGMVLYQTAPILMDMVLDAKFSSDYDSISKSAYQRIFDVDLLIIDDLGSEILNNTKFTELFNIINTRLLKNKKTVISTNLDLKYIIKEYDDRVVSRLIGNYIICKFIGEDIRVKKQSIG